MCATLQRDPSMMRTTTKQHVGRYDPRRAPLRHKKKMAEDCTTDDPFCLPFGHLSKTAAKKKYGVTDKDLSSVTPCCTRKVFYPHHNNERYFCIRDLEDAVKERYGREQKRNPRKRSFWTECTVATECTDECDRVYRRVC